MWCCDECALCGLGTRAEGSVVLRGVIALLQSLSRNGLGSRTGRRVLRSSERLREGRKEGKVIGGLTAARAAAGRTDSAGSRWGTEAG
eukprot:1864715-Rhodomonas_salina.1